MRENASELQVPPLSHKIWRKIVTGEINIEFEFLGIQRLLSQIRTKVEYQSSQEMIEESTVELRNFFIKTQNLPTVQKDLKKLLILANLWTEE